jgi:geranylgeranyl diphosphate synthase type I
MVDSSFAEKMAEYKEAIEADIADYAEYVRRMTRHEFGQYPTEAEIDIFLDILARGGKRIRGALVMAGYEMCGGKDRVMIIQAARALEMLHAYILIIDDIQDRSKLRRGKPSAHEMLAEYHQKHKLKGDAAHAGISLALNAALAGGHAAQIVLANLNADAELRMKAVSIVNRTMMITAHGQTVDIMNELVDMPTAKDIDDVLEWKTALYTIINPLHVGMVLAGVGCRETDAITPYALHAGKAFQITDDILGIFGQEKELGKTPGDDIREGKGTILTQYALEHCSPKDKLFLQSCLGNSKLTEKDFEDCRRIIEEAGALVHARAKAAEHIDQALAAIDATQSLWTQDGAAFLRSLAATLQHRVA